ncbi:MAG: hypothetical protein MUE47_07605, partial [Acidobacteria bacterium]|nr:hypothetical protein [Acidobacteriota bacterium]
MARSRARAASASVSARAVTRTSTSLRCETKLTDKRDPVSIASATRRSTSASFRPTTCSVSLRRANAPTSERRSSGSSLRSN